MQTPTFPNNLVDLIPPGTPEKEKTQRRYLLEYQSIEIFKKSKDPVERLGALQKISQFTPELSEDLLQDLAKETLPDNDHRIRGEMCYGLGRSNRPDFIPWLQQMRNDDNPWVQHKATEAIRLLEQSPLQVIDYSELQNQIYKIEQGEFDNEILRASIAHALSSPDPEIRQLACQLVERWSKVSLQEAAQFEPQLRRMGQSDLDAQVRQQALSVAGNFAVIRNNKIDLDLFRVADVYRKLQTLHTISQRARDFDFETTLALIDCALRDAAPLIRGAACLLIQKLSRPNVWKWTRFEPQTHWMAFNDSNPWVCKQAVAVAQKLYWPAAIQQWGLPILLCLALAATLIFASLATKDLPPAPQISIPLLRNEYPYANSVAQATNIGGASFAIGSPDGNNASVGSEANSMLVLDMGQDTPIVTCSGIDFYYYGPSSGPGVQLDTMQISVAQGDGSGKPDPNSFKMVYVWGDNDPTNNGSIPPEYFKGGVEQAGLPIESATLHNKTGIGIDISGDEKTSYRFVQIQAYQSETMTTNSSRLAQVDAIERVCPSVSPVLECVEELGNSNYIAHFGYNSSYNTATTIPIGPDNKFHPLPADRGQLVRFEPGQHSDVFTVNFDGGNLVWTLAGRTTTASSGFTRCPTPTPTPTMEPTVTPTPEPTNTPTPTSEPTNTSTPTPESTNTPSPSPTATDTLTPSPEPTNTPPPTPIATDTPTPTPEPTSTPSPSPTATGTPTPTPEPTNTPSPPPTSTDTPTPIPTLEPTPTPTHTPTPTTTPSPSQTATNTPKPSRTPTPTNVPPPTRTPTNTPKPVLTFTSTASPTHKPIETLIPTPTDTPRPTRTFTPTTTPSSTRTATDTPRPLYTPTPTNTPLPTRTPTNTPKPILVFTSTAPPTRKSTETLTPIATNTPKPTHTPTPTSAPTLVPTVTHTPEPIRTFTPMPKPTEILPPPTTTNTPTSTATRNGTAINGPEQENFPYGTLAVVGFVIILSSFLLTGLLGERKLRERDKNLIDMKAADYLTDEICKQIERLCKEGNQDIRVKELEKELEMLGNWENARMKE